ncbi:MAG: ATP-binding protein [Halodesulfurarchaeum sp.]
MSYATPESGDGTPRPETVTEVLRLFPEPFTHTAQWTGNEWNPDDMHALRELYGVARYDRSAFMDYPTVVPDVLEHYWNPPEPRMYAGGTELLIRGGFGSGKSTFDRLLAYMVLDINNTVGRGRNVEPKDADEPFPPYPEEERTETVVWRGSSKRSEWLPLAPIARLCLPSDTEIDVRLDPKRKSLTSFSLDVDDLANVVREVVYYDSPTDLNRNKLRHGGFNVVYPDPRMRGCNSVYEDSPEFRVEKPSRGELFHPEDSADHWWFGWFLSRLVDGPFPFTTWISDEMGDLTPQSASKDEMGTYQKIELMARAWADARKKGLSIFTSAQTLTDFHEKIRRKFRWRSVMAGTSVPTNAGKVVGWESTPFTWSGLVERKPVGWAVVFTQTNWMRFKYPELPYEQPYILSIFVGGGPV